MRAMSGSNSCFLISRITIPIMDATTVQDFILKTFSSSMYHAFSIQVVTRSDCLSHLFFIQFSCRMNDSVPSFACERDNPALGNIRSIWTSFPRSIGGSPVRDSLSRCDSVGLADTGSDGAQLTIATGHNLQR